MNIYIPTFNREKVLTLNSLSKHFWKSTYLVVDSDSTAYNFELLYPGIQTLICPVQGQGVHIVRDWIMSYGHKIGLWALVMLDDDLQFRLAGFNDEDKKIFRKAHPEELEEYFVECYKKCLEPNVGKVSFSQEFFNTTVDEWAQNKDSAATHFVNLKTQKLSGASFLLPLDERRFELETIEKGFELWANTMISVKKLAKHGVGGDSAVSGRGARIESALKYLSETYPRFVKIRKSTNSAYIQNYGTDLAGTFHYANMWKAVKRGEDVRK